VHFCRLSSLVHLSFKFSSFNFRSLCYFYMCIRIEYSMMPMLKCRSDFQIPRIPGVGLSAADAHKETNGLSLLELCIYMLQYIIKHLEAYKMVWRSMPCDRGMHKSNRGKISLISLCARCRACVSTASARSFHFSPQVGSEPTILNHVTPSVLADVSASLFDFASVAPRSPPRPLPFKSPRASPQALLSTSPGFPTFSAQRHKSAPLQYLQRASRTSPSTPQESGSVPRWRLFIAS